MTRIYHADSDHHDEYRFLEVTDFLSEWESEYIDQSYKPNTARASCLIGAIWCVYDLFSVFLEPSSLSDPAGGNVMWVFLTYACEAICSVILLCIAFLLSFNKFRYFCVQKYEPLCLTVIVSAFLTVLIPPWMLEQRRFFFQWSAAPSIRWKIEYLSGMAHRNCNDTNPVSSWLNFSESDHNTAIGCSNLILSGSTFGIYNLCNLCPLVFGIGGRYAATATLANCLLLIAALLSDGVGAAVMFSSIGLQLALGLSVAFVCDARRRRNRENFAFSTVIASSASRSRSLLHTLMPPNVVDSIGAVASVGAGPGAGPIARNICHCTVMFCSLAQQGELHAAFSGGVARFLDELFSAFDDAVEAAGMYKYQHVGEWYIVACPRAATPFDAAAQAAAYPSAYSLGMLRLAAELRSITCAHVLSDGRRLDLLVGIDCGPVAGAVIGVHRAFYCLYGDTMNTAARMCKYAAGGAEGADAHCTAVFAADLQPHAGAVTCTSRGLREIKGKGIVETFNAVCLHTSVEDIAAPAAPSPPTRSDLSSNSAAATPMMRWAQPALLATTLRLIFGSGSAEMDGANAKVSFRAQDQSDYGERLAVGLVLHVGAVLVQASEK